MDIVFAVVAAGFAIVPMVVLMMVVLQPGDAGRQDVLPFWRSHAEQAARGRGHLLGPWQTEYGLIPGCHWGDEHFADRPYSVAVCERCSGALYLLGFNEHTSVWYTGPAVAGCEVVRRGDAPPVPPLVLCSPSPGEAMAIAIFLPDARRRAQRHRRASGIPPHRPDCWCGHASHLVSSYPPAWPLGNR